MSARQWGFILVASAGAIWLAGRSRPSGTTWRNDASGTLRGPGILNIEWRMETTVGTDWEGVTYAVQRQVDHHRDGGEFETGWYRAVRSAGSGGMVDGTQVGLGTLTVSSGNAGWMLIGSQLRTDSYADALSAATLALNASGTSPPVDPAGALVGGAGDPYAAYGNLNVTLLDTEVNRLGYNDPFSGGPVSV